MPISADFTVNGDPNPAAHETDYGDTVSLALTSLVGVASVQWSVVGTSHASMPIPTITPSGTPVGSTASFTFPPDPGSGRGRTLVVKCLVATGASGLSTDNEGKTWATQYAVIGVPGVNGIIPIAVNEELYRSATHGWVETVNEALNTAGGGGDFELGDIPEITGVLHVDKDTNVAGEQRNGSAAAPFDTIEDAIDVIVATPGVTTWTIVVAAGEDGAYAEDLDFPEDVEIHVRGSGAGQVTITGAITWDASSTSRLTLEDIDLSAATITVSDGSPAPSSPPAVLTAIRCDGLKVAMDGGASGVVNVTAIGAAGIPQATSVGLQMNVRSVSVLGTLSGKGVKFGVSGDLSFSCSGLSAEDCVFEAGVSVTQSGTGGSLRSCRFVGARTFAYSGSAGTLAMDVTTLSSWATGNGQTITNGGFSCAAYTVRTHELGVPLGNADATIDISQGSVRSVAPNTLTADRQYTGGVSGATDADMLVVTRFDATSFQADFINGGPAGGTLPLLAGYSYAIPFDGTNWDLTSVVRLKTT